MKQTEIKAVFFDIGNVLVRFDVASVARNIAWALRRHPIKVARYLWSTAAVAAVERGELTPEELYDLFRGEFSYEGDFRAFTKLWCHFELDRRCEAVLRAVLRKKRVYLLSNTNDLHYAHLQRRFSFPKLVDGAVLSYQVHMRKPEPGIYEAAIRLAGVKPSECLVIDDNRRNVDAAKAKGMRAIQHSVKYDLRKALRELGVL